MQIGRIKFFLAVVISESFTEAAEILYATQSGVSKQIMALEKELGITLFDRSKRKATLTPEGRVFLEYAKKLLDTYNEMNDALGDFNAGQGSHAIIACIPVIAHYGIISLISEFRQKNPAVNLIVDEREAIDIIHGLEDGQYEMAFMRNQGLEHARFQQLVLYEDRLALLLPQSHPLAGQDKVSINQLKDETFMMMGKQTGLYDTCVEACRHFGGFTPKVGYTGIHMENIVGMVAKNMGVALLMETPARYILKTNTCIVPVEESITSAIVLTRLRKGNPSVAGSLVWSFFSAHRRRRDVGGVIHSLEE